MGGLLANAADAPAARRCVGQSHTVRGNPFTEETKKIWRERFGARLVGGNGYGITEACVITSLPAGEYAAPGSSGKRIPGFDVRIIDELDRELPTGTAGEIVVRPLRPDLMFMGCWKRPADTHKLMRNLWFHTGEIGKFDEQGFFYFVDRKKRHAAEEPAGPDLEMRTARRGQNRADLGLGRDRHQGREEIELHSLEVDASGFAHRHMRRARVVAGQVQAAVDVHRLAGDVARHL